MGIACGPTGDGAQDRPLEQSNIDKLEKQLKGLDSVCGVGKKYRTLGNLLSARLRVFDDCVFSSFLADLTNQTGLLHQTKSYANMEEDTYCVTIVRERPPHRGFWNAVARFFGIRQTVLSLRFEGQLWCCRYYEAVYFMTAEQIRDLYYQRMRKYYANKDLVIMADKG